MHKYLQVHAYVFIIVTNVYKFKFILEHKKKTFLLSIRFNLICTTWYSMYYYKVD